jgi:hypothetical protein
MMRSRSNNSVACADPVVFEIRLRALYTRRLLNSMCVRHGLVDLWYTNHCLRIVRCDIPVIVMRLVKCAHTVCALGGVCSIRVYDSVVFVYVRAYRLRYDAAMCATYGLYVCGDTAEQTKTLWYSIGTTSYVTRI